jgi:hypothetical protein
MRIERQIGARWALRIEARRFHRPTTSAGTGLRSRLRALLRRRELQRAVDVGCRRKPQEERPACRTARAQTTRHTSLTAARTWSDTRAHVRCFAVLLSRSASSLPPSAADAVSWILVAPKAMRLYSSSTTRLLRVGEFVGGQSDRRSRARRRRSASYQSFEQFVPGRRRHGRGGTLRSPGQ